MRTGDLNTVLEPSQRQVMPFVVAPQLHHLDRRLDLSPVQRPLRQLSEIFLVDVHCAVTALCHLGLAAKSSRRSAPCTRDTSQELLPYHHT